MEFKSKFHKKLRNSKHATVSLDSLLGILSSAYGTEELDSNVVFDKSTVNWQKISVDNFKTAKKKLQNKRNTEKTLRNTEIEKDSVTTSTTNLNPNKNSDSDIDVTLLSIKSLINLNQTIHCLKQVNNDEPKDASNGELQQVLDGDEKMKPESERNSMHCVQDIPQNKMEEEKAAGDSLENQNIADHQIAVCESYVYDRNDKIVFDIQFTKNMNHKEMIPIEVQEPEICINLIDITKQVKSWVVVDKTTLISKSMYFDSVDKEFGLENLNVVIRCNFSVFQWIIQWIRADIAICKPNLNLNNLKPLLLMAYHLNIDQLVEECLDYFHSNNKNVLETNWDIEEVLDDDLFLKLVKRFSHAEIDAINDYFGNFKDKMYCSLISHLVNPNPCFEIGHYSTLATIFQCSLCKKLFHYNISNSVFCRSDCNELNCKGDLVPLHEKSSGWNLSKYIDLMYEELGSWRIVYWRLWGICHFLKCIECKSFYPLTQSNWCPYHPEPIEFFPLNSNSCYPIGTYKCCSDVAFKFNVLNQFGGCTFKSHTPELDSYSDIEVHNIYQRYKYIICRQSLENNRIKKFVKLVKINHESECLKKESGHFKFCWEGIRLAPKEKKDYSIIPQTVLNLLRNRPQEKKQDKLFINVDYGPPTPMGLIPSATALPTTSTIVEKNDLLNEMHLNKTKKNKPKLNSSKKQKTSNLNSPKKNKMKTNKSLFLYKPLESCWINCESNKDNQDNQRDFEEIAMRKLVKILSSEDTSSSFPEPIAGTYIHLESKWLQEHGNDDKMSSSTKTSGTVVNRTFPLSWFRRLTI